MCCWCTWELAKRCGGGEESCGHCRAPHKGIGRVLQLTAVAVDPVVHRVFKVVSRQVPHDHCVTEQQQRGAGLVSGEGVI